MIGRVQTGRASKRLLIVSPNFPPVSSPDMQRVRMSLPYFAEFGWEPYVLAVRPGRHAAAGGTIEPLLNETLPPEVPVERVRAVPLPIARLAGIGNVALRAMPFLYRAGCRLIEAHEIDLVYFSTTMFLALPLGRLWKRRFGTPFVIDFQDPWLSDYYDTHPSARPPAKYGLARRLHAMLEPWTMKQADGMIAVSPEYIATLTRRYPWMREAPSRTLPFGASSSDFDVLERHPQVNRHFVPGDGHINGVYAGRGGDDLSIALDILFRALGMGLASAPDVFGPVALHFVGTDYATDSRARKTVAPVADLAGVGSRVHEDCARAPYFEALQLLKDADFLLVVGSDDPAYTASKVYPYILARKPLLAIVHERSSLVGVLRETRAGHVVTFPSSPTEQDKNSAAELLKSCWHEMLRTLPRRPDTDWTRFERYSAREMTRQQCELFDTVLDRRSAMVA